MTIFFLCDKLLPHFAMFLRKEGKIHNTTAAAKEEEFYFFAAARILLYAAFVAFFWVAFLVSPYKSAQCEYIIKDDVKKYYKYQNHLVFSTT